ncbi:MAG: hypothetical protein HYY37_03630 [Candidatus Aenigmarchaeota archaeon]|nr:hypothetical protein [Candidatus Aenigmarchaeota archaeon]
MAKFIRPMPELTNSEVKAFLEDLSKHENVSEEEKGLIRKVRKLRDTVGSPVKSLVIADFF